MENDTFDKNTVLEVEKIFFSLEDEYVKQLMEIPDFYKLVLSYYSLSNEELMRLFSKNYDNMETFAVEEKDEHKTELEMIACVVAMASKIKQLRKTKAPDLGEVEETSYVRCR